MPNVRQNIRIRQSVFGRIFGFGKNHFGTPLIFSYIASTNIYMCEIITIGRRLAHASSLTYRFWGDASREESLFGLTPRARRHPIKCEASPHKMRGVTPTPARSHPENGGMAPHQFFENNYFSEANQLRVLTVHEGHMGHYHH